MAKQNVLFDKIEAGMDKWFSGEKAKKVNPIMVFLAAGCAIGWLAGSNPILTFVVAIPVIYVVLFLAWKFRDKPKKGVVVVPVVPVSGKLFQ